MCTALFHDDKTPVHKLISTLNANPVHLSGKEVSALCGEGKLFELWPSSTGFTVGVINLHAYIRDHDLDDTGVILRIPETVDGVPVTRIASGAFQKWLSYDTLVRVLDFPDTMLSIAQGTLDPLSVEHIHIPQNLTSIEPQIHSVGTHAKTQSCVHFHVDASNPAYASDTASNLYTHDFTTLITAAYPYAPQTTLDARVQHIADNAFVQCDALPTTIVCPTDLQDTRDYVSDDVIWIRQEDSVFARFLDSRKRYGGCSSLLCQGTEIYDSPDGETLRLIRSTSSSDTIRIPTSVAGKPLTRIGMQALPHYVESLDIPGSIIDIAHDNPCPRLRRLILHEGLASIGHTCFTSQSIDNIVLLPTTLTYVGNATLPHCTCRICADECTVFIPDFAHARLFGRTDMLFDYDRYDTQLPSIRSPKNRVTAILERLSSSHSVTPDAMDELILSLKKNKKLAMQITASLATPTLLNALTSNGFYTPDMVTEQIALLQQAQKPDGVACMVKYKNSLVTTKARPSSRFAL